MGHTIYPIPGELPFEYKGLYVKYHADDGKYDVWSTFGVYVGQADINEGPGAVIRIIAHWLDWSETDALSELLSDLNSTLE